MSLRLVKDLTAVLLELPISVVEGANLASLQPSGDTMEMEGVVANPPCNSALLAGGGSLICLTFDAQVHNVVSADGTVVDDDVPSPQSDRVPLLHLKALLAVCSALRTSGFSLANCLLRRGWDIGHNDVGHVQIADGSKER